MYRTLCHKKDIRKGKTGTQYLLNDTPTEYYTITPPIATARLKQQFTVHEVGK